MDSETTPKSGAASGLRVFLSYSRKDKEFIARLADVLTQRGYLADFDQSSHQAETGGTGIAPTDDWWLRLQDMIAAADVMVLAVSPDSAASKVVDEEIAYARSLSKRVIAVTCRELNFATAPPRLSALNVSHWFIQQPFEVAIDQLCLSLDRDVEWLRTAARYTVEAKMWDDAHRPADRLLFGEEIAAAEAWSARRPGSAPQTSELVLAFLAASRAAETDRQAKDKRSVRRTRGLQRWVGMLVAGAFAITAAGAWFVVQGQRNLGRSQSLSLAAAAEQLQTSGDPVRGLRLAVLASRDSYLSPGVPQARAQIASNAQASSFLMNFIGHTKEVSGAAFSSDEKRLLTWSVDGSARLWDVATGAQAGDTMQTPNPPGDSANSPAILSAIFSPDNSRVLTANSAGARLWDAATGKQVGKEMAATTTKSPNGALVGCALGAAFSDAGNKVIMWDCKSFRIFDATTQAELVATPPDDGIIWGAALAPSGARIITWNVTNASMRQWDTISGAQVGKTMFHQLNRPDMEVPPGMSEAIWGAVYGKDGSAILSWGRDGFLRIWNATTGDAAGRYDHGSLVTGVRLNANDSSMVSWGMGLDAHLWSSLDKPAIILKDAGSINGAQYTDDNWALTWNLNGAAQMWSGADGTQGASGVDFVHGGTLNGAAVMRYDRVATWGEDGAVRVWEDLGGKLLGTLAKQDGAIKGILQTRDGSRIVTWGRTGEVRLWSAALFTAFPPVVLDGGAAAVDVSHDGTRAIRVDDKGAMQIVDLVSGKEVGSPLPPGVVNHFEWSDDDTRILADTTDQGVILWDGSTGAKIWSYGPDDGAPVSGALFLNGGAQVLTSSGSTVTVWDTATLKPVSAPLDLVDRIAWMFVSEDRSHAVVSNGHVHVLSGATGKLVSAPGGRDWAGKPIWSRDGKSVFVTSIAAGVDQAQEWDVLSGEKIGPAFKNVATERPWIAFSPDGSRIFGRDEQFDVIAGKAIVGSALGTTGGYGFYSGNSKYLVATAGTNQPAARLFDATSGAQIGAALSRTAMSGAAFSDDSSRFVLWGDDGRMGLYDSATGAQIGQDLRHWNNILGVRFSKDGQRVTAWTRYDIKVWDIGWAVDRSTASEFAARACKEKLRGARWIDAGDVRAAPVLRGREGEDVCSWSAPWYDSALRAVLGWLG